MGKENFNIDEALSNKNSSLVNQSFSNASPPNSCKQDCTLHKSYVNNGYFALKRVDKKTKKVVNFALKNKSKALVNYLIKYITKNDGTFTHLAYHCSRDYSNLIIRVSFSDSEWAKVDYIKYIDFEAPFENEWMKFYKWKSEPPYDFKEYFAFVNRIVISLVTNN